MADHRFPGVRERVQKFLADRPDDKGQRGAAALAAALALIPGLWLLNKVIGDATVSGEGLFESLLAGAALGSVVPLVAGALKRQDERALSKLGMTCRAELSIAMGVVAGLTVVAAADATTDKPLSAPAVVLAAAVGAAGALRVARALVARAGSVLTITTPEGKTVQVAGKDGVDMDLEGVKVSKPAR
jgi:hypothetical protein